jgi:tRNA U34 5-methylaminomethyl-2-thiouridine-forming methyltransferase MnmC
MGQSDAAELIWLEGDVPASARFDDPYFSRSDGLAETRHVFLAGNGLPGRFRPGFHVAELGFGTGLNMLALWLAWQEVGGASAVGGGTLRYTGFEAYPLEAHDIARALAAFPEVAAPAAPFLDQWAAGARRIALPGFEAEILIGDANETLPRWSGRADAWFLDGFAPARNPGLWSAELMQAVADHTAPGGAFATYTAAGHVRRALQAAGFSVERAAGFGHKRHMTMGRKGAA